LRCSRDDHRAGPRQRPREAGRGVLELRGDERRRVRRAGPIVALDGRGYLLVQVQGGVGEPRDAQGRARAQPGEGGGARQREERQRAGGGQHARRGQQRREARGEGQRGAEGQRARQRQRPQARQILPAQAALNGA